MTQVSPVHIVPINMAKSIKVDSVDREELKKLKSEDATKESVKRGLSVCQTFAAENKTFSESEFPLPTRPFMFHHRHSKLPPSNNRISVLRSTCYWYRFLVSCACPIIATSSLLLAPYPRISHPPLHWCRSGQYTSVHNTAANK